MSLSSLSYVCVTFALFKTKKVLLSKLTVWTSWLKATSEKGLRLPSVVFTSKATNPKTNYEKKQISLMPDPPRGKSEDGKRVAHNIKSKGTVIADWSIG